MIDHHIQKRIIVDLVECESARYADLKPKHIEGNVFTYHLHALVRQKFIEKGEDGRYSLTQKGKLYGINTSLKPQDFLEQAHSIILLCVRDGNRWLLRQRLAQPLYGKIGFIHGEPRPGETVYESAARILHTRTNLRSTFAVRGSGYIHLTLAGQTVAYSHFTVLEAGEVQGILRAQDTHGINEWLENPNFSAENMIPSMPTLVQHLQKDELFFVDLQHELQLANP